MCLYPDMYNLNILKERLFYGMTQHLRDSMRYLYKESDTGFEQLLSAAREAETEWVESKTIKFKATSIVDPRKKDRDKLKAGIDKLTKELKVDSTKRKVVRVRTLLLSVCPRDLLEVKNQS